MFDFERREGQDFVVDVELEVDTAPAASSDDVADTVDYGVLANALAAVIGGEPVNLIETLAARLADVCLADARVAAATVTVHKPQAPIEHQFADVAVTHPEDALSVVLSIGSNLGDRLARLQGAIDTLRPWVVAVSPVYETAPWGPVPQDDYLNAIVLVDDATPHRVTGSLARTRPSRPPGVRATCDGARARSTWTWWPSTTCAATIRS